MTGAGVPVLVRSRGLGEHSSITTTASTHLFNETMDEYDYKHVALRRDTFEKLQIACEQRFGTTSIAYSDAIDQFIEGALAKDEDGDE